MLLDIPDAQTAISSAQTADDSDDGVVVVAGKRYLTLQRLARTLKKSPETISRWNERRLGPPRIKIGNLPLFDEEKLPGWLAEHEVESR